jgi:hypothetical protein
MNLPKDFFLKIKAHQIQTKLGTFVCKFSQSKLDLQQKKKHTLTLFSLIREDNIMIIADGRETSTTITKAHHRDDHHYDTCPICYTRPGMPLVPPLNFAMIASGVYRSGHPNKQNFAFLRKLGLKTILYGLKKKKNELFKIIKVFSIGTLPWRTIRLKCSISWSKRVSKYFIIVQKEIKSPL